MTGITAFRKRYGASMHQRTASSKSAKVAASRNFPVTIAPDDMVAASMRPNRLRT